MKDFYLSHRVNSSILFYYYSNNLEALLEGNMYSSYITTNNIYI